MSDMNATQTRYIVLRVELYAANESDALKCGDELVEYANTLGDTYIVDEGIAAATEPSWFIVRLEGLTALREANELIPGAAAKARKAGMSMDAIAKALGMSRQGLYQLLDRAKED